MPDAKPMTDPERLTDAEIEEYDKLCHKFPTYIQALRDLLALRRAVREARRSNGQGGFLDCWCDSERGHKHGMPKIHTQYCLDLRALVREE